MPSLKYEQILRPLLTALGVLVLLPMISASAGSPIFASTPMQVNPAVVGINGATLFDAPDGTVIDELAIATVLDPSGRSQERHRR